MKIAQRHYPSGLNSYFQHPDSHFAIYLQAMRTMISQARLDLTHNNKEHIITCNSPFEYRPKSHAQPSKHHKKYQRGILLLHGLYDSPYHMQPLGRFFQRQGFLVRSILLPGHGTIPGDLTTIHYQEWIKATQYGLDSLAADVDDLYVLGYSTGATLAIYHFLQNYPLKALFLFCPALQISHFAAVMHWHKRIARYNPKVNFYKLRLDDDYVKYRSLACNAATQLYLLIRDVTKLLQQKTIDIPTLMVLSADDNIISSKRAMHYFGHCTHPLNKLILYRSKNGSRPTLPNAHQLLIKNSVYLAKHIINFSHNALAMPEDDPHYGANGDFTRLMQQQLNTDKNNIFYGEFSMQTLILKRYRYFLRLTYNPDFAGMLENMQQFLQRID